MQTALSIIIVNWNGINFLPDCLKSIAENPPNLSYEVIVIDNASSDKSIEWLSSKKASSIFPDGVFKLVESKENLGFGRANNLLLEDSDSAFVFILNPDTLIKKGTLDKLISILTADDKVGISVPKIVDVAGVVQSSVWAITNALKIIVSGLGVYHFLPKGFRGRWLLSSHWTYDEQLDVPLACGCAMLARREMIEDVGAFDSDIFMYGEDTEWCYRMGGKGWKVRFEPNAEVVHAGGQSSKQRWSLIDTRIKEERAWILFQQKCLTSFSVKMNILARLIELYPRVLLRRARGKETEFLDKLIPLQLAALKTAFSRVKSN